jgi:integrase
MQKNPRGVFEKVKGSGEWWIRYNDAEGRRRREKAGTKAVAIKLYTKRKQQALEGMKLPESLKAKKITFGELLDDAVADSERNLPEGGEKRYKCRTELIRETFGSVPAESITPEALKSWLEDQRKKNKWRPATRNRYKAFFSLAFRLGIENGKCKVNPARAVKRLRENNERTRFLSEQEEQRIREVMERDCPEHLPEFEIALHSGARQGEQYRLEWDDVSLDGRRATFRRTKNGDVRHTPLNAVAHRALSELLEEADDDQDRIFIGERGAPLKKPRHWWDKVLKEAGIKDFHWHDLRHTFASRLVMAGVDLRTVAQLLGHRTLQMVMRYAHLSQSHELAAVERLCNTGEGNEKRTATSTATSPEQQLREVA